MAMPTRRWFHPHISGGDAESLLTERGAHGSYLVRPSKSNPGDFTLSVRRGNVITHIKIQNSGDYYDLYGGEKFATLTELIQHYTDANDGQLRELGGDVIELRHPLLSEEITNERWYHGHVSGSAAGQLLMEKGQNGSYLVRASSSKPGDYVLTVRCEERVTHIMIGSKDGKFDIGGGDRFDTLPELVDYYKKTPIVETSGNVVHLRQPYNATKFSITAIEDRVSLLQKQGPDSYGKGGFFEEFEHLQTQETKHLYSRKEGARAENRPKNRYKNILPFDYTRVTLRDGDPTVVGSDYINANYISGETPGTEKHYIATQGCLPGTVVDFWRMVWQENSRVLVMITNEVERGRNKCTRYWPDEDSSRTIGRFIVTNEKETTLNDYILREFRIKPQNESESRTVYHFQFKAWRDHSVPSQPGVVLSFLHEVNSKMKSVPDAGPMVVHCSAGIGRTGTIVVIDIVLKIIQQHGIDYEIDIQKTVQHVRSQRSGLVQTEAQYKFCYMAIMNHIETLRTRIHAEMQVKQTGAVYDNLTYPVQTGPAAIVSSGAAPRRMRNGQP